MKDFIVDLMGGIFNGTEEQVQRRRETENRGGLFKGEGQSKPH